MNKNDNFANGGSSDNFIVRIYRRKELNGELFGVVEEIGKDGRKAFHTVSEMVDIIIKSSVADKRNSEGSGAGN